MFPINDAIEAELGSGDEVASLPTFSYTVK